MKTSTLILVLSTLSAYPAYSQAAGGYAGAAAASQITAQGSAQALGHAQQTAISQAGAATANASANHNTATGAAGEASAATVQSENTTLSATRASSFPAELTQKVSSKNARVGDEVVARTTSTAQLAGGTRLPKGTKLMGKVTEVESRSGAQRDGHLAFAFDRAVLHDGRQIPIHAALDSISEAPAVSTMAGGSDEFAGGGAPVALSGGGRASGGLLGGGGVAVPHTGLVSSAASNVASTPARVTSTTGAALQQTVGVVSQTSGSTFGAVSNLPGVMARSSARNSTILDAKGSNVELSSGTQLMLTAATR
jgi:hypothetical protein